MFSAKWSKNVKVQRRPGRRARAVGDAMSIREQVVARDLDSVPGASSCAHLAALESELGVPLQLPCAACRLCYFRLRLLLPPLRQQLLW